MVLLFIFITDYFTTKNIKKKLNIYYVILESGPIMRDPSERMPA